MAPRTYLIEAKLCTYGGENNRGAPAPISWREPALMHGVGLEWVILVVGMQGNDSPGPCRAAQEQDDERLA